MHKLAWLPRRASYIFESEGLVSLLRRGFIFLLKCLFMRETYYLYERNIEGTQKLDEADFLPSLDNFTLTIVATNKEADELEADGFEFRRYVINAKERLDKGAVAFCVFCGYELASIGWVAMTEEAMRTLFRLPCQINFSDEEVYFGQGMTVPKYRDKGLFTYGVYKRLEFVRAKGKKRVRVIVAGGNIAAQKAMAKLGFRMCAEARYQRILSWVSWKEKPHP